MRFFSEIEIKDILVSLLVLSVVFSYPEFLTAPAFFIQSLLVVGVAFIGHELSHKFTAIREGFWSEYRMWPQGILMALLFALATGGSIIFAAPGAVYFSGDHLFRRPSRRQLTRISMAGISFNIALMWISVFLAFVSGIHLFAYMALINGWLAIFNLIPFGMLDGGKLLKLDRNIWILLFVLAIAGFVASQFLFLI